MLRKIMTAGAVLLAAGLTVRAAESHFFKDVTVQPGDTLQGDLSLYRGNLVIQGCVDGNVVVMFGDCRLDSLASVLGNLAVVQGNLELRDAAQVGGRISQKDFLAAATQEAGTPFAMENVPLARDTTASAAAGAAPGKLWDNEDKDLFFSFNRVAGLQLGLKFPTGRGPIHARDFLDLTGHAAWAFGAKRPEWRLKLRRRLVEHSTAYLAAGMHRLTDTQDNWMLTSQENAMAGWLLKQDYHDYVDSRGYQVEAGGFLFDELLQVSLAGFREKYGPLDVSTQWNWSGNDSPYRPNLFSDSTGYQASNNQGLRGGLDLRLWRDAEELKDAAWQKGGGLTLTWEKGLKQGDYDFAYQRLLANLRFAVPLGSKRREHLSGRILAGNQTGSLPDQYRFRLGGPDALPGYRPKAVDGSNDGASMHDRMALDRTAGGTSMLLFSLENRFSGEVLDFWPFDELDMLLMTDVGQVVDGSLADLNKAGFRSDFGIGIADDDDDFKLALFRATDSGEADWRLLCRVQRRF